MNAFEGVRLEHRVYLLLLLLFPLLDVFMYETLEH